MSIETLEWVAEFWEMGRMQNFGEGALVSVDTRNQNAKSTRDLGMQTRLFDASTAILV